MQVLQCHLEYAEQLKSTYPKNGKTYAKNYLKMIESYVVPKNRLIYLNQLIRICQEMPSRYKGYSKYAQKGTKELYAFMVSKGYSKY